MRVAKPKAAPTTIDGKLDDACWNDAKPVTAVFQPVGPSGGRSDSFQMRLTVDDVSAEAAVDPVLARVGPTPRASLRWLLISVKAPGMRSFRESDS
ncbi:MAG TPA: hypothetical protein VEL76_28730 [Gemmataceae bacterium]|nr:hypothetical protein [Gemmataceae bacterium]